LPEAPRKEAPFRNSIDSPLIYIQLYTTISNRKLPIYIFLIWGNFSRCYVRNDIFHDILVIFRSWNKKRPSSV